MENFEYVISFVYYVSVQFFLIFLIELNEMYLNRASNFLFALI